VENLTLTNIVEIAVILAVVVVQFVSLWSGADWPAARKAQNHCNHVIVRGWVQGASIVPAKVRIEWPYVVLLVGIVLMVAAATHLLSTWVAYVIFGVLWIGFAIWSKIHRWFPWWRECNEAPETQTREHCLPWSRPRCCRVCTQAEDQQARREYRAGQGTRHTGLCEYRGPTKGAPRLRDQRANQSTHRGLGGGVLGWRCCRTQV